MLLTWCLSTAFSRDYPVRTHKVKPPGFKMIMIRPTLAPLYPNPALNTN